MVNYYHQKGEIELEMNFVYLPELKITQVCFRALCGEFYGKLITTIELEGNKTFEDIVEECEGLIMQVKRTLQYISHRRLNMFLCKICKEETKEPFTHVNGHFNMTKSASFC